jgi:hypothetical protein
MIFIDPSELRETSNLLRYLSDVVYNPLPGLEALTGADVMISPGGLPSPLNDTLVLSHIKGGAKLLQLKFGHDLPSSVVDGRLNEALSRMLTCGAMHWQSGLLFIGLLGHDDTKGMATINGQLSYGNQPMGWSQIDQSLGFWTDRGGYLEFPLASGNQIPERFDNIQNRLNRYTQDENTRNLWPKAPIFYDEIESDNPTMREWQIGQKLVIIDDLRPLLCTIPGARIGPERATAIFNWMAENNVRQDFLGFMDIVRDSRILEVPGIGKGIQETIRWGLFRTLEERNSRNEK